jgi:type III secretion protein J
MEGRCENSVWSFGRWVRRIGILLLLIAFSGCASQKTIINGLDERDANEIIVFLASKNIEAHKVQAKSEGPGAGGGGVMWDIVVDSTQVTEAMSILNANGLPRRRSQKLLELFAAGGLVPSEMQEKVRYQAGLAEQISGTIRKIDGIIDADVQLSFPEEDPLNPKAQKAPVTASVFVKHQGVLDDPNSHLITKIRRLVASSVQGLSFENVTVIADRARFSDVTSQLQAHSVPGEVEHVKVWDMVISKESLSRFQIFFFALIAVLAIFILVTIWLVWKVLPLAREAGGLKQLFSVHPLEIHKEAEEEKKEETVKQKAAGEGEGKGPKVQENIEST